MIEEVEIFDLFKTLNSIYTQYIIFNCCHTYIRDIITNFLTIRKIYSKSNLIYLTNKFFYYKDFVFYEDCTSYLYIIKQITRKFKIEKIYIQ